MRKRALELSYRLYKVFISGFMNMSRLGMYGNRVGWATNSWADQRADSCGVILGLLLF